jgi:hypothetical protein
VSLDNADHLLSKAEDAEYVANKLLLGQAVILLLVSTLSLRVRPLKKVMY